MKRRYRRYFIMLELEDKDSGILVGEETKGYAKVEIRNGQGLLSFYCQNLKSSSNDNKYLWYLINTRADGEPVIVEIGSMEVDEKGKGEATYEFDAENVNGSMEQIDNFDVLILVALNKSEKDKTYVPLVGYIDKKRPGAGVWRYALGKHLNVSLDKKMAKGKAKRPLRPTIKEIAKEPEEEIKQEIAKDIQEEIVEETAEEIEIVESIAKEKAIKEIEEKAPEGVVEEAEEAEETAEEPMKEITEEAKEEATEEVAEEPIVEAVKDTTEETVEETEEETGKETEEEIREKTGKEIGQEDKDSVETEEDEYEAQMQAYIENSLKNFSRVKPFVEGLENYTWWQIPYSTYTMYRAYMPFISYLDSLKDPADHHVSRMLQIIYIHQHHIFGICYDQNNKAKHYAYGILGRNLFSEQPFELDRDLVYWHPCNNVPINIESYGYWILMIDPKTGDAIKHKNGEGI